MIHFRDAPAPPPAPAPPTWPGRRAFFAAPHVRIDGGHPIAWAGFVAANALDEEEQAEVWNNLAACGVTRVCGHSDPDIVLTGCGKPGSAIAAECDAFAEAEEAAERAAAAMARDPRSLTLRDLLAADGRTVGLGPITVILGGVVLRPTADGRSLIGTHVTGSAR